MQKSQRAHTSAPAASGGWVRVNRSVRPYIRPYIRASADSLLCWASEHLNLAAVLHAVSLTSHSLGTIARLISTHARAAPNARTYIDYHHHHHLVPRRTEASLGALRWTRHERRRAAVYQSKGSDSRPDRRQHARGSVHTAEHDGCMHTTTGRQAAGACAQDDHRSAADATETATEELSWAARAPGYCAARVCVFASRMRRTDGISRWH